MNISSKYFNSNFAHNIVIYWSLFKMSNKVYITKHTKEKSSTIKLTLFCKIGKVMEVKRVGKIWIRMSTNDIYLLQFQI